MEQVVATVSVKAQLKALFADLGMVFPKCASTRNFNGETLLRKKAMIGGSTGPMTVTNAWVTHCREAQDKVMTALAASGLDVEVVQHPADFGTSDLRDMHFTVRLDARTVRKLKFTWMRMQTYHHNMGYDRSYLTCWYVCDAEDVKVAKTA